MENVYMTIKELANYLRVKQSTVYNWVNTERVPVSKVVGQWRFKRSEIDEWIKNGDRKKKKHTNGQKIEAPGRFAFPDDSKKAVEKRRYFRLVKNFPVRYSLADNPEKIFKAIGRNISEGGLFIEAEDLGHNFLTSLKDRKKKLSLVIELPEGGGVTELYSEIVWLSGEPLFGDKIGMGLKFSELLPEISSKISSYILKHSTSQDGIPELLAGFPIKVESSVIVKRPKEEVYNCLKHMEQFPKFMEYVKQVDIIEGRSNRVITEWEVYFDDTTFTWKEEDIFNDEKMVIRFKMLEGDFGRYEGEWQLISLLAGTEIRLRLIVDWGLSVLNKYMQPDLEKMTQERVQNMLSALKKEMWVNRITQLSKFVCVIHPLDIDLVVAYDNNVSKKKESVLRKILERMPVFWTSYITGIKSLTGKEIEGEFVMCPLLPEQMLNLNGNFVLQRIIEAGKIAEERGARIFGLAAYTANVGRKGILVANALNIPVTAGTSYTVATAIEATLKAAEETGIELHRAKAVIIGATGAIGSICSQVLADRIASLTLVARNKERLENFANLVRKSATAIIKTSGIIDKFLFRDANIVITATNTPTTLINVDFLPAGIVVCDMSLPRNISEEAANSRKDILVIDGGIVKPPGDVNFNFYFGLSPGLCYACIAEPMILTLEERFECYSIGGHISVDKVKEISQLASKHGFKLAELRSFGKEVSKEHIEEVKQKRQI